jgi:hypothetical protein
MRGRSSTVIINAVILVSEADPLAFIAQCTAYCHDQGYRIAGVVEDNWGAAVGMLSAGLANVIVMGKPEHFDPAWEPRVEFASEAGTNPRAPRKGPQLQDVLERLWTLGASRVVFPGREYRSGADNVEKPDPRKALYETARLFPRGDDAGFAEDFLERRVTGDT